MLVREIRQTQIDTVDGDFAEIAIGQAYRGRVKGLLGGYGAKGNRRRPGGEERRQLVDRAAIAITNDDAGQINTIQHRYRRCDIGVVRIGESRPYLWPQCCAQRLRIEKNIGGRHL